MTPTPSPWGRPFRLSFPDTKKRMPIAMCQNITSFQETQERDQWQTCQSYQTDFSPTHLTLPHPKQSQKMKGVGSATSVLVFIALITYHSNCNLNSFLWKTRFRMRRNSYYNYCP